MLERAFEILPRNLRETWEAPFSFQSPFPTCHLHVCYLDTGEVKQVPSLLLFFLGVLASMAPIPYYPFIQLTTEETIKVQQSLSLGINYLGINLSLSSLEAHLLLCTGHKPSRRLILCVKFP